MNTAYLLCLPALLMILLIATARLIHMTRAQWTFGHHVRRLGFIMVIGSAISMIVAPFVYDAQLYSEPSFRSVMWAWGLMFVWVNSPNMPPLADYILGVHRNVEGWRNLHWKERLQEEWRAVRRSFMGRTQ